MDITNPNNLWRDYNVDALPLNISALSDKTENGIRVREFYFDGCVTTDGRVRTYIKILENPESKGVILYLPDKLGADENAVSAFYERGYTIALLDYLGETDEYPRFTLYPYSLNDCNCYGKTQFEAPDEALSSCWYIWTCMARRAVMLLKSEYTDKKIYALGVGLGGCTVYKLAAFDDVSACATLLNVLPTVNGTGNPIINYRASLDNSAYAPLCKTPLFMALASNDEDGSLDDMSELAYNTESLAEFRILERTFSGGIKVVFPQITAFFENGNSDIDDMHPEIEAINSEKHLYYNIKVKNKDEKIPEWVTANSVEIFTSFCIEDPTRRSWTGAHPIRVGDGEFMARVDVLRNEKPVYAFANITDTDGNVKSSPLLTIVPKTLGIPSVPAVSQRLIYDGSMGKDVWMSPNGGTIEVKSGLFGIDGISSDSNMVSTFKPCDPLFRAESGALLQIMLSGEPQTITVSVMSDNVTYTGQINIPSSDSWHKVTLSHLDFKAATGPLSDWSNIIMISFKADAPFIIGSVLWV